MAERVIQNGLLGVLTTQEWTDLTPPEFELGTKAEFSNGDVFRLVRATAAKTVGLLYQIDENWLVGAGIELSGSAYSINGGIPEATSSAPTALNAAATYTYFWIQTAGNFDRVETTAAVADNAAAYTTATAGKLDDGDASGELIQCLKFTALTSGGTNTTAYSAVELHITTA